jgi:ElaB/YqjD/DUF883 family membrane-anchored ribosome-binding protein
VAEASKTINGNEKNLNAARKAAESAVESIQEDFRALQQDVAKLTQQLAKLAAAKGFEAVDLAKGNLDEALEGAKGRSRDLADAASEVRDNFAAAIEDSLEQRPYTTLALALAAGFVAGAVWRR